MSLALRDVPQVNLDGQPSMGSRTSFAQYAHKPLQDVDEIRLLCIKPGSWESDPQCILSHHRIPDCPPFEALSYVWGSEEKPCKIGCGESGELAVTRNCFTAIKRLRRLGSLVVWIDAVCIDQENDVERGHQVKNMPTIYKSAARVLVYLGEAEDHGDEAMEILRCYKWFQPSHPDTMVALRKLMQRSWFERIWVLQEVNKARTVAVICGDHVIPWDPCFRLLVKWGPENFVRKEIPYTLQMRGRDRSTLRPLNLFDLIVNTRFHHCTDPRDRIFALLSMSSEDSSRGIEPDYTVTMESVYARVARHFLSRIGFNLLAMVDHGHRKMSKLPSWVPDWSRRPTCTPITKLNRYTSLAVEDYSLIHGSTMRISGKSVGTINDLGQVFQPGNSGWDNACVEDWSRLFVQWHPDAAIASLDPIIHMSELYKYDMLESLKTGFRCLVLSAAHFLRRIVQPGRKYGFERKMVFHPHDSELLCIDEFVSCLCDSQSEHQTALELLSKCSPGLSETCMELFEMRFQTVSCSSIITNLKSSLIDEIHKWDFYENRPFDGSTPHFSPFPFAVQALREYGGGLDDVDGQEVSTLIAHGLWPSYSLSDGTPSVVDGTFTLPDEYDEILPILDGTFALPEIRTERKTTTRVTATPSEIRETERERRTTTKVTGNEFRMRKAITSLIRMRFSLEFPHVFPSVKRLQGAIPPYKNPNGSYWGPYDLFREIMDQNLNLLGKRSSSADQSLQERIEQFNLTSIKRINDCCKGRRLFVNDHIAGLVPARAQKGDVIYIPSADRFPILLREVDDHYVLVGACYVVGDIEFQACPDHDVTIS